MRKQFLLSCANKVIGSMEVPDWGQTFFRRLSLHEVSEFESQKDDPVKAIAYLITKAVCDEAGQRIFDDADITQILALPVEIALPLGQAITKTIGITTEQVEQKKSS